MTRRLRAPMGKLTVSAVSYLNALPLVYGLMHGPHAKEWLVRLEVPSRSARSLAGGQVDLALMPVGAMHKIAHARIVSDFCIGAIGPVYTVCLLSHTPLTQISTIYLDPHSKTSVQLVRILAEHHWNIHPQWRVAGPTQLNGIISENSGIVLIGDKVFSQRKRFPYAWDLAEEWIDFSALPFVFAAWITNRPITPEHEARLNASLAWGISHTEEALAAAPTSLPCERSTAIEYLRANIDYPLTAQKRDGLRKYLSLRAALPPTDLD